MGRFPKKDAEWREAKRRVSKTVSIPRDILRCLEADGKASTVLTEILETHYERIGTGEYHDRKKKRVEKLALIIEDLLKKKLVNDIRNIVEEAIDRYMEEKYGLDKLD